MKYTTHFSELKKFWGLKPRNEIRTLALDALAIKNQFFFDETLLSIPRIQFLYFHHVFEDEVDTFEQFVAGLAKHHVFISHTEAVEKILNGTIDQAYICWSSDDGFKNNIQAAKILERYGAKTIFYLNPNSIGIKSYDKAKDFCSTRLFMPPIEFLDWNDVEHLLKTGHEIGSHSMEHLNMGNMDVPEVTRDLMVSKELLEEYCGTINHFAYPFGRAADFTKTAFDLVFKTGYTSCASAMRGCHHPTEHKIDTTELLIRRDQISANWALTHLNYLISRGAKKPVLAEKLLPEVWFP